MRSLLYLSAVVGFFLLSCGNDHPNSNLPVANGGKKYGGEFRYMSIEKVTSLFPSYAVDLYSSRVVAQMFDPLMSFNTETMQVVPVVAESFDVNEDATVYTFHIRKGIQFHDDDCFSGNSRELKASDVKFTLDLACSGLEKNEVGYLLQHRIKGADEYAQETIESLKPAGVSGVKVVDDYTVEITLNSGFPGFERVLTNPSLGIVSKVAYDKYGAEIERHPIGSGPFSLAAWTDDKVELNRNPSYWKKDEFGNQLPFLEKIVMTYTNDKRSELIAFGKGEVDLVLEIPVDEIQNILGTLKEAQEGKNIKHRVDSESSLSMAYVSMDCESEAFSDVRVRKAFNCAINREEIIESWLEGEGWAANNGFVPKMSGYENDKVKGHLPNVAEAKKLMAAAGFKDGQNFPTLDFYVNAQEGSWPHKMCNAISAQLKENLNVNLNIKLCSFEEREEAIKNGSAKIWRSGWVADYPDPENFLSLFYSRNMEGSSSTVNSFNFKSEEFDDLYEQAITEGDEAKRKELLVQCDQTVIDEAAVLPVLTDDHIVMINARVRNFEASPMEALSLKDVFIKEMKK